MPGFLLVEFPIPRKAIYRDRGLTPSPRAANLRLAAPRPSGLLYPAPLHMIYPGRGSSSLRDSSHSFRIAGRLIAADFALVASPRDGPMLVRLRGPNDHVSIVWKVVVKRLALADQFFTRRRSMNVIDQLVLSLIEFVRAKGRFVAVVNELIGERRLRVHELDGSVAVRCVNQHPGWLSRFRMFSIWASGFDVDEIPSPNNTWLL
jgi:hypothetical protein